MCARFPCCVPACACVCVCVRVCVCAYHCWVYVCVVLSAHGVSFVTCVCVCCFRCTSIVICHMSNIGYDSIHTAHFSRCIRIAPELCKAKVERIMWMGGASSVGGNASAWAEANAAYDPEAAHIVLTSGVPITMYTWDVYLKVAYTGPEIDALVAGIEETEAGEIGVPSSSVSTSSSSSSSSSPSPSRRPWSSLAQRLMHRDMRHFQMDEAQIGDAGAVAAVIDPSSITTRAVHVAMELTGSHTRGMTVVDHRAVVFPPDKPKQPANVDLCVGVDASRIKAVFSRVVLRGGAVAGAAEAAEAAAVASVEEKGQEKGQGKGCEPTLSADSAEKTGAGAAALRLGGHDAAALKAAGFTALQCKEGGFGASDLWPLCMEMPMNEKGNPHHHDKLHPMAILGEDGKECVTETSFGTMKVAAWSPDMYSAPPAWARDEDGFDVRNKHKARPLRW